MGTPAYDTDRAASDINACETNTSFVQIGWTKHMGVFPREPGRGWTVRLGVVLAVATLVAMGAAAPANALETRSYVIGWFSHATNSTNDDCSDGVHPEIELQYLENLRPLGYSEEEIEEYRRKLFAGEESNLDDVMQNRGRVDGEPVNPYTNPATVTDPNLPALDGKYAYGFDLDGKGADAPNAFIDPETGESGVDHEMYRALGCARPYRGTLAGKPTYWDWLWGQTKMSQPVWLVTVRADNFNADGGATIAIYRAVESLRSNSDGSPRSYVTYRIDPDPRSHNEFKAQFKNGVASVTEHKNLRLLQNPLSAPELNLASTHLRLHFHGDGTIRGFVGGYQPWEEVFFGFATTGGDGETTLVGDIPALYYLLRNHADADPDPETGINRAISTTYYFEAVPAFIVRPQAEQVPRAVN